MTIRIGCLHAHHSNIGYLDATFAHDDVELVHFVDPGLIQQVGAGQLSPTAARQHVAEQLQWMAASGLDAVIVTCTQYIATLGEESPIALPLFKIDEPFFAHLGRQAHPCTLLFTNPATVAGTMERLHAYAARQHLPAGVEPRLLAGTFELVMQGRNREYQAAVSEALRDLAHAHPQRRLAVAQLSMVAAAEEVAQSLGIVIDHPLAPLHQAVAGALQLNRR